MLYYHGSNVFFDKFDLSKSKSDFKVIHLTPNIEYAKNHALNLPGDDKFVYTVIDHNFDNNTEFVFTMSNLCFANIDKLEIINVVKINI